MEGSLVIHVWHSLFSSLTHSGTSQRAGPLRKAGGGQGPSLPGSLRVVKHQYTSRGPFSWVCQGWKWPVLLPATAPQGGETAFCSLCLASQLCTRASLNECCGVNTAAFRALCAAPTLLRLPACKTCHLGTD